MFLRILTVSMFVALWVWNASAESGEQLFQSRCVACHTLDGTRRVGPALNGITEKKSEQWLVSFIKSPQKVINDGDAYAKKLLDEYAGVMMPDQDLTDAQIKSILAFVAGGDSGAGDQAAAAEPTAFVATEEDVAKGAALFQGKTRFAKGGAACNSCHDVKTDKVIGGGILAKELTDVFSRIGDGGVKAIIASPPFPVMKTAYDGKELTDGEVTALMAFLQNVDQNHNDKSKPYGMKLFIAGLVGTILLFFFYSLVWSRRKRGTVYKEIFDRQTKSQWE